MIKHDPSHRTCSTFTLLSCIMPIYGSSKLQTETATSTMEAEIIAFGSCCHKLLPIIALVDEIGVAVGIKKPDDDDPSSSTMHVTIHEDNLGALILAAMPPPQFTPCSSQQTIFARRSLRRKSKSPQLRHDFNREISLPRYNVGTNDDNDHH